MYATTSALADEPDLAEFEFFDGHPLSGRNRYPAMLVVLNELFKKI